MDPSSSYARVIRDQKKELLDANDEIYATTLKKTFKSYISEKGQTAFNAFTENLMDEPRINRFVLLQALDDFQRTDMYVEDEWSPLFLDEAWNCRPHQPCIIC
jgi:hypothetical protein